MLVASPFDLGFGETALRLALATVVGALLGLDREIRGHAAGLRTHGVVSLSSAVITISALLLFEQLRSAEAQPDPLRVVQGLAQAIGFIAAGLIFVKGGDVRNLTSAANIWLATAIGIACGAGQYGLVVLAAGFGLLLVIGLRAADQWLPEQSAKPNEQDRRQRPANADRRQELARTNGDDNGGEMADDTHMRGSGMGYGRFAAMIVTSTVVMFGLMYLNTYAWSHVEYSQTRTWMAVVMGATMALIMIGFMWGMYKNIRANIGIVAGAIVVFAVALWLVRSQETVDDVSYMKAMIPHHSIAIMTSERAHIKDPEVRKLADGIIDAQVREITEMKRLIARLEAHPTPNGASDLPSYRDRQVPPPAPETDESAGVNTLKPIR